MTNVFPICPAVHSTGHSWSNILFLSEQGKIPLASRRINAPERNFLSPICPGALSLFERKYPTYSRRQLLFWVYIREVRITLSAFRSLFFPVQAWRQPIFWVYRVLVFFSSRFFLQLYQSARVSFQVCRCRVSFQVCRCRVSFQVYRRLVSFQVYRRLVYFQVSFHVTNSQEETV